MWKVEEGRFFSTYRQTGNFWAGHTDLYESLFQRDLPLVRTLILSNLQPSRRQAHLFLDLGCEIGWFSRQAEMLEMKYVGIDLSGTLLRRARPQMVVRGDVESLPFQRVFTVVHARGILHHVPKPARFLSEIGRVTVTQGLVVLEDPNPRCVLSNLLRRIMRPTRLLHSEHERPVPLSYVSGLLKDERMEVVAFLPIDFLGYYFVLAIQFIPIVVRRLFQRGLLRAVARLLLYVDRRIETSFLSWALCPRYVIAAEYERKLRCLRVGLSN